MPGDKARLRYSKTGPLRLLSHHDLLRCLERMLRRAGLPFRSTQGFHPTPRLVFALPCPLGVEARNDAVEVEFSVPQAAADVQTRLNAAAPEGLHFHAAREVPLKATAVPRRAVYRVPLPAELVSQTRDAAAELLAADKVWVERQVPNPRRLNLRPFVRRLTVDGDAVTVDLWVTQSGTARADELVRLLGLNPHVRGGAVVARVDVELHDETPPDASDRPPEGPPEVELLSHAAGAVPAADDTPGATWGLSPAGPAVE